MKITVGKLLESLAVSEQRVCLSYGDSVTGRDWLAECPTKGYIAVGSDSQYLLQQPTQVDGGFRIPLNNIVRITKDTGAVLYEHKTYHRE